MDAVAVDVLALLLALVCGMLGWTAVDALVTRSASSDD